MGDQEPVSNPYQTPPTTDAIATARRPGVFAWGLVVLIAMPAFATGFAFACMVSLIVCDSIPAIRSFMADRMATILFFGFAGGLAGLCFVFWIGNENIKRLRQRADAIDEEARRRDLPSGR